MDLSFPADPFAALRSLYRRAYLAALAGEANVASDLQSAWREALAGVGPIDSASLVAVLDEERRRVDAARVVADVLEPHLQSLSVRPSGGTVPANRAPAVPAPDAAQVVGDSTGAATPEVADLLDSMLRQDALRLKRSAVAA